MVVVRDHEKMYPVKTVAGGDHDEYNHDYYGTWFDFGADGYAVRDQIYRSGISLVKIDKEMHSVQRQGDATLEGAEFTIVNASLASARNKDGFDIETAKGTLPAVPTWQDVKNVVDSSKEPEARYGGNAGSGCYVMQVIKSDEQGHAKTGRYDLPLRVCDINPCGIHDMPCGTIYASGVRCVPCGHVQEDSPAGESRI